MIGMYVNWDKHIILNEEQFYNKVMEITEERIKDPDWVGDFLSGNYSSYTIFNFTDEEKENIKEEMWQEFEEETIDELIMVKGWEKIEVES